MQPTQPPGQATVSRGTVAAAPSTMKSPSAAVRASSAAEGSAASVPEMPGLGSAVPAKSAAAESAMPVTSGPLRVLIAMKDAGQVQSLHLPGACVEALFPHRSYPFAFKFH